MLLLGIDLGTSSVKVSVVDTAYCKHALHLLNIPKQKQRSLLPSLAGQSKVRICGGNMYSRQF